MTAAGSVLRERVGGWITPALVVAAIWLGWQCVREVGAERLPPALALSISAQSPRVLARAAEAEFAAERLENAEALARDALRRAPFDVRAVRVLGMSAARTDRAALADNLVTLAGNWSLRDDPAHAWLIETRLQQGSLGSAMAHADTLARRREDLYPQLFNMFETAAKLDPRAAPPLVGLLAQNPPWRYAFVDHLQKSRDGLALAVALAEPLERTSTGRLTNDELYELYSGLIDQGFTPTAAELRRRLQRPPTMPFVFNGAFAEAAGVAPFDWKLSNGPGVSAAFAPDDVRQGQSALRVSYDGFAVSTVAEQLVVLPPGRYKLTGERRTEAGRGPSRLSWVVLCRSGVELGREPATAQSSAWEQLALEFTVPDLGCDMQWIRLVTRAQDRRSDNVVWFDRMAITPA